MKCPLCNGSGKLAKPDLTPLSETQQKYYNYLLGYMKKNKCTPTIREFATNFNVCIKASHDILERLAKKGYISIKPKVARGIILN